MDEHRQCHSIVTRLLSYEIVVVVVLLKIHHLVCFLATLRLFKPRLHSHFIGMNTIFSFLLQGWRKVESRSRPGEFVYENLYTEERQAWFPDTPAEKVSIVVPYSDHWHHHSVLVYNNMRMEYLKRYFSQLTCLSLASSCWLAQG